MIFTCVCSHMIVFGRDDFVFDIRCENCKRQSCGKCFKRSHYPALCHEYESWVCQKFQGNAFNQRLAEYAIHWNFQDMILDLLNMLQTHHEEFSHESHQRFHKRLILPFNQMREIVHFNRWFRVHAVFNPIVESVLANEHALLETRMAAFLVSIPPPDVAANEWTARLREVMMISIDLGVSVAELIFGIPKAHNVAQVEEAHKAVLHWTSKMVS